MRTLLALAVLLSASSLYAGFPDDQSAQRAFEQAVLEWRLYDQVERPAAVRRIAGSIRLAEAELASLDRRLREFEPMNRFSSGNAFFLEFEQLKLLRLQKQLELEELREEQIADIRFHADRVRLLELRAQAAHDRCQ